MVSGMAFHGADSHRSTSQGAADWNRQLNFFRLRNRQKLVRIRFENIRYIENLSLLHNEELNDLYCSPNIVRVIKWRRMRWAGHVAHMSEERGCIGSWWGNRREGDYWEDLGVDVEENIWI